MEGDRALHGGGDTEVEATGLAGGDGVTEVRRREDAADRRAVDAVPDVVGLNPDLHAARRRRARWCHALRNLPRDVRALVELGEATRSIAAGPCGPLVEDAVAIAVHAGRHRVRQRGAELPIRGCAEMAMEERLRDAAAEAMMHVVAARPPFRIGPQRVDG